MIKQLEFGIVGLGKMGGNLARQALDKKMRVVGLTKHDPDQDLLEKGLVSIDQLDEFKDELSSPRAIFLYIPAGKLIDRIIGDLASYLEEGDIIVDGGNSYWGDSIRRSEYLKDRGIYFVDLGTSGGVDGALNGACFMAGGEKAAMGHLEPILTKLAVKDGYVHAGSPGAGHFVKLVHNGIEFGMLQAIGEGMDLLTHYKDKLKIPEILHCWNHGSVIRSWLIELMEQQTRAQKGLESIPGYIEDTGEVNWLINDAMEMEVPVPVIAQSVMQLFTSRDNEKNWARAVAMMRHGFGGHPFGEDKHIAENRRTTRVGAFYRHDKKK